MGYNFTFRNIGFAETGEYKSPKESWGQANSRMTVEYLTPWATRRAARLALLGTTTYKSANINGQSYTYLSRINPHQYPSGEPLYCTSVPTILPEGTPTGNDGQTIAKYTDARLTAIYEYLEWDILEDAQIVGPQGYPDESQLLRNIVAIPTEAARQLTFRAGVWRWVNTGPIDGSKQNRPVETRIGIVLATTDWDYLWVGVPLAVVPKAAILAAAGKVNGSDWDGMVAGSFLVKSPGWERTRLPDGTRAINIHIRGTHNARGWNNYPDPQRANAFFPIGAQTIFGGPITAQPYPITDIPTLFRPSQVG